MSATSSGEGMEGVKHSRNNTNNINTVSLILLKFKTHRSLSSLILACLNYNSIIVISGNDIAQVDVECGEEVG